MKQMKGQNKNNDMLSLGKDSQIAVVRQTQTGLRASRSRTLFMWYIIPCSSSILSLTELQQCEMNSRITGTFDRRCVYKTHVCNSSSRRDCKSLKVQQWHFLTSRSQIMDIKIDQKFKVPSSKSREWEGWWERKKESTYIETRTWTELFVLRWSNLTWTQNPKSTEDLTEWEFMQHW